MGTNNYTLDEVKKGRQCGGTSLRIQRLSSFGRDLPLVLVILKSKVAESEPPIGFQKFYAPIWVDALLERLSTQENPLSDEEYYIFCSEVGKLSVSDYKIANNDLMGYKEVYTSIENISEVVLALKHYFKFL